MKKENVQLLLKIFAYSLAITAIITFTIGLAGGVFDELSSVYSYQHGFILLASIFIGIASIILFYFAYRKVDRKDKDKENNKE